MQINYIIILISGFLLGMVLVKLIRGLSVRFNFLIIKGVSACGGLGFVISFFIVSLFFLSYYHILSKEFTGIILSSFFIFICGIIDDWRELSVSAKLIAQFIAIAVLIGFGVRTQIIYLNNFLNIIITALWVLGITNAINHLDVMDGIAAGAAIIISSAFFVITFFNNDFKNAILTLVLAAAVLGFLRYNLPPAKAYMGNAGSHFLGFLLSAIAINISYSPGPRRIALISPILILGFPILDSFFLICRRMMKGRLIFRKSDDHLVLQFLKLGYSKTQALVIMLSWCFLLCLTGIAVVRFSHFWASIGILMAVIVILFTFKKAGKILSNG